jgi:hypothetical protein
MRIDGESRFLAGVERRDPSCIGLSEIASSSQEELVENSSFLTLNFFEDFALRLSNSFDRYGWT